MKKTQGRNYSKSEFRRWRRNSGGFRRWRSTSNEVEFPTQPKPYSTASSTDFPQVTAHAPQTYCYQLIAATTTLGVARVIRACLPIRCDSSNRVLPTPGDAIPSNGLPPRPPPGQYCPQLPSHRTTPLSPNRAVRPSDSTESPPTPTTTISPSDRPVATAAG